MVEAEVRPGLEFVARGDQFGEAEKLQVLDGLLVRGHLRAVEFKEDVARHIIFYRLMMRIDIRLKISSVIFRITSSSN